MQRYTYSVQDDFPNHKVASERLAQEVRDSSIVTALAAVDVHGDDCDVWFRAALSVPDTLVLSEIVAAHSGEQLEPTKVMLASSEGAPVSLEPDNRLVVVNFPADTGSFMWLCGRGDGETGRGKGQALRMQFASAIRLEPETQQVDIAFWEPVQLHDGQLFVRDPSQWGFHDEWSFSIHFPASVVTPNPIGAGNCNLVASGAGFNLIVPAAGDGTHDVQLDQAVPIPAAGGGYWDYSYDDDVLSPAANPGSADWHVIDVQQDAYFMRSIPIPWHPHGLFDFDAYKAERVMPRWRLRLSVTKASNGPGDLAGWVVVFRQQVQ